MAAKKKPTSSKDEIEDAEVVKPASEADPEETETAADAPSEAADDAADVTAADVADETAADTADKTAADTADDTAADTADEPADETGREAELGGSGDDTLEGSAGPQADDAASDIVGDGTRDADATLVGDDSDRLEEPAETGEESEAATPPPAAVPPPPKRGGLSVVVGGALAALLGFVVAQVVPEGWPMTPDTGVTDALADADAELAAVVADKLDPAALDPLATQLSDIAARLDALSAEAAAGREALESRIAALEDRPIVDLSTLDNSEAVEAELSALRAEIAAVSAEAQRQIEAARSEASILEQNAAEAADAAARRAALSRVLAALDSGVPYEATLTEFAEISGGEIPAALTAAAVDGVPTLSALQEEFPPLARQALAAMRAENAGGENTMGNFFRNQFGVRSLSPQDGDTPDAVLSRIEGALTEGRLGDALAEIDTLPESGAAVLAFWVARAESRLAAFRAADALTQSQTSN
ncbi:MAG: hypothetical protein AAFP13_07995 [Pseudomonadota bacterium]